MIRAGVGMEEEKEMKKDVNRDGFSGVQRFLFFFRY